MLPLIFTVSLLAWGGNWLLSYTGGSTESAAQIATMMLVLPLLVIGVILLVLTIGLIYLLVVAQQWIPARAFWLQKKIQKLSYRSMGVADLMAEPVLRLESLSSAIRRVLGR